MLRCVNYRHGRVARSGQTMAKRRGVRLTGKGVCLHMPNVPEPTPRFRHDYFWVCFAIVGVSNAAGAVDEQDLGFCFWLEPVDNSLERLSCLFINTDSAGAGGRCCIEQETRKREGTGVFDAAVAYQSLSNIGTVF